MKLLFDAKMGRLHGKVIRVIIEFAALVVHRAPYGECLPSTEGSLAHALQRMIFTKHSREMRLGAVLILYCSLLHALPLPADCI